jgi:hypothetical protein
MYTYLVAFANYLALCLKPTNFLRECLQTLHHSSESISQWRSIHDITGTQFQSFRIKLDSKNKDVLFSLQKSIGSISQSLADAKRSGQIPDSARQVHTEAAVLINSIALKLETLKGAFADQIQYFHIIQEEAANLQCEAQELKSALWCEPPQALSYVNDSGAVVDGPSNYHSNNQYSGPLGSCVQTTISRNARYTTQGGRLFSNNVYQVTS